MPNGWALPSPRHGAALATEDVPIGAVVIGPDGAVLGSGTERTGSARGSRRRTPRWWPSARPPPGCGSAGPSRATGDGWRLADCTLVVTLEPCAMCAGALCWPGSRGWCSAPGMRRPGPPVPCSTSSASAGSTTGWRSTPGVREQECAALLRDFFAGHRQPSANRHCGAASEAAVDPLLPGGRRVQAEGTEVAQVLPDPGLHLGDPLLTARRRSAEQPGHDPLPWPGSYCQSPMIRPRSRMGWSGRSACSASELAPSSVASPSPSREQVRGVPPQQHERVRPGEQLDLFLRRHLESGEAVDVVGQHPQRLALGGRSARWAPQRRRRRPAPPCSGRR